MDKGERYRTIAFFESNGWFGRWVLINKEEAVQKVGQLLFFMQSISKKTCLID